MTMGKKARYNHPLNLRCRLLTGSLAAYLGSQCSRFIKRRKDLKTETILKLSLLKTQKRFKINHEESEGKFYSLSLSAYISDLKVNVWRANNKTNSGIGRFMMIKSNKVSLMITYLEYFMKMDEWKI